MNVIQGGEFEYLVVGGGGAGGRHHGGGGGAGGFLTGETTVTQNSYTINVGVVVHQHQEQMTRPPELEEKEKIAQPLGLLLLVVVVKGTIPQTEDQEDQGEAEVS